MNFVCLLFGIAFMISGALFAAGKLHPHIAAWKQMSQVEKDKINILPLCRNIGEMIFLSGMIFMTGGLWPGFQEHWFSVSMIIWIIASGLDLWFIAKSEKYKRQ